MKDDELEPFFDPVSYGRALPERELPLSISQIKLITRTVGCTPEVMVKVINKGSTSVAGVSRHVGYIGRQGGVELETDQGEILQGQEVGDALLEDWNLDLIQDRGKINLAPNKPKQPPRLVYKLIFSVPAGTPPVKVRAAVRNFAREEFALKHRYVMALPMSRIRMSTWFSRLEAMTAGDYTSGKPRSGNGERGSQGIFER